MRGLVLRGDRLIFVVPATGEVRTVDATTGKTQATTHVAGVPWADTIAGGKLYVSIFNRSRVLVLNPRTLNRVSTGRTSRGPDQLAATERTVWVYSAYAHTIVPLRGPGESRRVIYTSNPAPIVTSNGTTLAIEGIEQISTLGPDGILRRSPLVTRTASALVMTPTGNLIAAGANQLLLIHR